MPNLSAFARLLGLPDDASAEAIVAEIEAGPTELAPIEAALGLPVGAGLAACLAEIDRLKAEEATLIASLNAQIDANLSRVRDLQVRELLLDACREARDALAP